jgi:hypothetical protein
LFSAVVQKKPDFIFAQSMRDRPAVKDCSAIVCVIAVLFRLRIGVSIKLK